MKLSIPFWLLIGFWSTLSRSRQTVMHSELTNRRGQKLSYADTTFQNLRDSESRIMKSECTCQKYAETKNDIIMYAIEPLVGGRIRCVVGSGSIHEHRLKPMTGALVHILHPSNNKMVLPLEGGLMLGIHPSWGTFNETREHCTKAKTRDLIDPPTKETLHHIMKLQSDANINHGLSSWWIKLTSTDPNQIWFPEFSLDRIPTPGPYESPYPYTIGHLVAMKGQETARKVCLSKLFQ